MLEDRGRYEVLKAIIGKDRRLKFILDKAALKWILGRMKENKFSEWVQQALGKEFDSEESLEEFIERSGIKSKSSLIS